MNVPANPEGKPEPEPQQVQMSTATARVPGQVGDGVFSTGTIVMTGPNEFVVDFVQQMGQPSRVVSRVVIPLAVMPQFITALEQNLAKFEQQFGAPPKVPQPENPQRPTIEQIYEQLKLPDEMLSGTYANAVLIRHSAAEFSFDFITSFYPHASVASRVFLSVPHVVPMLDSLKKNMQQLQGRAAEQQRKLKQQPPPEANDDQASGG